MKKFMYSLPLGILHLMIIFVGGPVAYIMNRIMFFMINSANYLSIKGGMDIKYCSRAQRQDE